MKNLKLVLFSVLTMGLVLASCSDDDSKGNDTSASLEGKWEYTREADVIEGQEFWNDYEHMQGCSKDFIEISATKVKDVYFDGAECTENSSEDTYVRNGNNLTITSLEGNVQIEILTLSSTTLKVKSVEVFEGQEDIYITEFTRK